MTRYIAIFELALLSALVLLVAPATAYPQEAPAEPVDLLEELVAAEDEILAGLSKSDRTWAKRLSSPAKLPYLDIAEPGKLKKGMWGLVRFAFEVDHVVDESNLLCQGNTLWIEGLDTSEVVDEAVVDASDTIIFEVQGTKNYETVLGANRTVKHLKAMDVSKAASAARKLVALQDYRIWRDGSGKFAVLAKFVEFEKGQVTLERRDGKRSDIALNRLSKDDQRYVREVVKSRAAPDR
jgi:hypothetical protein